MKRVKKLSLLMAKKDTYEWKYCSIGGVTRVNIASGEDIAHLNELDTKLWTVLSCPVQGLEADAQTLAMLDSDGDGKIRVKEVVAAAQWLTTILRDPDRLLRQEDSLPLSAFNTDTNTGKKLHDAARQILLNLGEDKDSVSLADTKDSLAVFAKTKFNGDGIITPAVCDELAVRYDLEDCLSVMGGTMDRSGEMGVNADMINDFYTACADYVAWMDKAQGDKLPYGDHTAVAYKAMRAVKPKMDDFFLRCRLVAFDEGCRDALDVSKEAIAAVAAGNLADHTAAIADCPLARPDKEAVLPLRQGINPTWQEGFNKFKTLILDVDYAGSKELTEADWHAIEETFRPYETWLGEEQGTVVEPLGYATVWELLQHTNQDTLLGLAEKDAAMSEEAALIEDVDKLLHLCRDFYKILRNYVIFSDFYDRSKGMNTTFQAGRLFIDQRCCELCVRVDDMAKHAGIAAASGMFLIYCHCSSKAKNAAMDVAAVLTKGDVGGLYVGQNAVFYDRQGQDWDAIVTKIIDNPISVRHAFWAPYRKIGKLVSDQVDKLAAEKDAKANGDLADKISIEKLSAATPAADGTAAAAKKPAFDIAKFAGIFAAIGLAVGALGAALAALLKGFVSLQWWQMLLTIVIVLLVISGPAMFIAWKKLKNRNLGPLLNANGWAINSKVLVNSRFGSTLTTLAVYPIIKTNDPYAEKTPAWVRVLRWVLVVAAVVMVFFAVRCQRDKQEQAAAQRWADSVAQVSATQPQPAATPVASEAAQPAATPPAE